MNDFIGRVELCPMRRRSHPVAQPAVRQPLNADPRTWDVEEGGDTTSTVNLLSKISISDCGNITNKAFAQVEARALTVWDLVQKSVQVVVRRGLASAVGGDPADDERQRRQRLRDDVDAPRGRADGRQRLVGRRIPAAVEARAEQKLR